METQDIADKFKSFLQEYKVDEMIKFWDESSKSFLEFWENKILSENDLALTEEEMNPIIRILDRNGKGNTKGSISVAKVMIPQGAWYNMFNGLKSDKVLENKLTEIFKENDATKLIKKIDELYVINEESKNSLTGKSGNALNALLFVSRPRDFLSVVSLNDRKRIIDFFRIFDAPDFETSSQGEKIILSNKSIIDYFNSILGEEVLPRIISDFLYLKIKEEWKNEIPDYQSVMLPILKFAEDGNEHHIKELVDYVSDMFGLDEEEKNRKLPSGYDTIINNRVGWARTYLKKAGLLQDPRRGYLKITEKGLEILSKNPKEINVKFLMQFPEFREFQNMEEEDSGFEEELDEEEKTPNELLEEGYRKLNENLFQDLLDKLRSGSPAFFEQVVVDLLVKMGYGKGEAVGGPGDGGIDGIIYQDPLKMDKVYLQAKRYNERNIIGSGEIWKFIGVLEGKGANKGVFITTSKFHPNVYKDVSTHKSLALIDGEKLVELMVAYDIGVAKDKVYEIKKIDTDYFEE